MTTNQEQFIGLLTRSQPTLYAYIMSLLPDPAQAQDLLQETNMTMWSKADEFEAGSDFVAWGCRIAYFKVLSHRRRLARDRHMFDDELLDYLAERQQQRAETLEARRSALRKCLEKLPRDRRELIESRYRPGGTVQALAKQLGRTEGAISQTLYRIRQALGECIRTTLAAEQMP